MHLTFLCTGEACDPCHGNSSLLVRSGGKSLLLDRGFSVPHAYFGHEDDPEALAALEFGPARPGSATIWPS